MIAGALSIAGLLALPVACALALPGAGLRASRLAGVLALPDAPLDAAASATRYREAVYLEEVVQDLDRAVAAYLEVADARASSAELAAGARLRAGGCLELAGRAKEAIPLYGAILRGAPAELASLRSEARRRIAALETAERSKSSPDASIDRLESEDPAERYRAIEELRALPPEDAVAALARRLVAEAPGGPPAGPRIRHYGVILLGHLKDPAAVPALKACLADPIPEVRCNAALSLYKLGDRSGLPVLETELSSAVATVRSLAARHLSQAGSRAAAPILVQDLASPDAFVRSSAIQALVALFGEDLGFLADAPEDAREEARKRWEERVGGKAGR